MGARRGEATSYSDDERNTPVSNQTATSNKQTTMLPWCFRQTPATETPRQGFFLMSTVPLSHGKPPLTLINKSGFWFMKPYSKSYQTEEASWVELEPKV